MLVKHISSNRFDVFYNNGWDNWARFQVENGKPKQTNGFPVPKNIEIFLAKRYSK